MLRHPTNTAFTGRAGKVISVSAPGPVAENPFSSSQGSSGYCPVPGNPGLWVGMLIMYTRKAIRGPSEGR